MTYGEEVNGEYSSITNEWMEDMTIISALSHLPFKCSKCGFTVKEQEKFKLHIKKCQPKKQKQTEKKKTNRNKKKKSLKKLLKSDQHKIKKISLKKSSKQQIEKEIELLIARLKSGEFEIPRLVSGVIKSYRDELVHRNSGIRQRAKIVSGGATGLKK